MTQPARTKTWQRVIDCTIGAIIVLIGSEEFTRFLHHPIHHQVRGMTWSILLTASGVAIIAGAVLRTVRPGQKQSIGFQFELAGWGAAAFLIFFYAVVDYTINQDLALLEALLLIVTMLLSAWLRLIAAMRDVIKRSR